MRTSPQARDADPWLRWIGPDGEPLPTRTERAVCIQAKLETAETKLAEAERKIAELEAELRRGR